MFVFCLYLGFVILLFKSEYPNFASWMKTIDLLNEDYCKILQKISIVFIQDAKYSKRLQQSIESTRLIIKGMGVVLCKDFWSSDWGSQCVVFLSFVLSNGTMVLRKFDHVICVGMKILRREASGLKKMKLERFDLLKTPSLFMMKKTIFLLVSK